MIDVVIETSIHSIWRDPSSEARHKLAFHNVAYITYACKKAYLQTHSPVHPLFSFTALPSPIPPSLFSLSSSPPFLSSPHCVCLSDPVAFCCAMKGLMPHSLFSPLSLSPLLWLEQSPLTDALSQLLSITVCAHVCVCVYACMCEWVKERHVKLLTYINHKCFQHTKCLCSKWGYEKHTYYIKAKIWEEEKILYLKII